MSPGAKALLAHLVRQASMTGCTLVDPQPFIPDWTEGPVNLNLAGVRALEAMTIELLPRHAGDDRLYQHGVEVLAHCRRVRALLDAPPREH